VLHELSKQEAERLRSLEYMATWSALLVQHSGILGMCIKLSHWY